MYFSLKIDDLLYRTRIIITTFVREAEMLSYSFASLTLSEDEIF